MLSLYLNECTVKYYKNHSGDKFCLQVTSSHHNKKTIDNMKILLNYVGESGIVYEHILYVAFWNLV